MLNYKLGTGSYKDALRKAPDFLVFTDGTRYNMQASGYLWYLGMYILEPLGSGTCNKASAKPVGYLWDVMDKLRISKKASDIFPEIGPMRGLLAIERYRDVQ